MGRKQHDDRAKHVVRTTAVLYRADPDDRVSVCNGYFLIRPDQPVLMRIPGKTYIPGYLPSADVPDHALHLRDPIYRFLFFPTKNTIIAVAARTAGIP